MRGEQIVLPAGTKYYYRYTSEEYASLKSRTDGELDSAGEPKLVSRMGVGWLDQPTVATVLKTRKIEWFGLYTRPRYLLEVFANLEDQCPRVILVSDPRKKLKSS